MLNYILGYVTCILDDAKVYANHAKKKVIELDDVKLACQMTLEKAFTAPPPREVGVRSNFKQIFFPSKFKRQSERKLFIYFLQVLLELARNRNATPLPVIKTHCGLRLPPERHCLLSANYKLRASEVQPKKLTKSALDRGTPKIKPTPTALKRQSMGNPSKGQNVNIPKPVFKFSGNSNAKSNGTSGPRTPTTTTNNQQIKFEPDIKMEMDDDYSDLRGMKRKREDEDDDDFETVGY